MLSIIIPTLNEEKYLPNLLESIKNQDFKDYEIIVSDAGSKDKTLEIAKKYGCKFTIGGLPAKGRNEGAKIAKGSVLLFLDADTLLQKGFLKKNIEEFNKRGLGLAGVLLSFFEGRKFADYLLNIFYNIPIILMEKALSHTAMVIFVKKEVFDKINGFDQGIIIAEDHDMGRRASKISKFGILRSEKALVSRRRFEKDGWIRTYIKYVYAELHMIFKGPIRESKIIKYEFDHYRK